MDKIKITESEWKVMQVIWQTSPLTSKEIITHLTFTNWNANTIHTLLSRLSKKGVLIVEKKGRFKLYSPAYTEIECQTEETLSFLEKVYNGSVKNFLANFVTHEEISHEDLKYLKELIKSALGNSFMHIVSIFFC